ncbi:hypothetical protein H112_07206 [Trichophyton rubrum D6]|uniref:VOC domain-containing protein n=5 Tax=Trichophyton TaxID=5550 RepID=A0A178EZD7_TRIRU|nr:uncharacterized protein TERG_02534 [Trichophyton rubrum CBS 118892]EZF11676.1 hypothetical protein H100_07231 [Trichophyton rubrum MR850]EZF38561.1 hypothetical protein H102_07191 [Trichophyton rubrum CBS 100081]EZF49236.1 hypothetical protein H103_07215 [Trichophyton rubrum CBS 288.86]EZF59879.1 hypothetical protein H104_07168 [Trichophyton rubrum CBS 289.86]EZF70413.1 hypothetical protein H105_07227 [Trichophyton soudanense CBS 452.61]EZF81225.1 hypothetical protein H110_07213 [Trichophy
MCDTWTPPSEGTPCWVEIFATDLARAEKFYSTVFNWQFIKDGPGRTEDVAMFSFPEKGLKGMGGNLSKIKPGEHTTGPKTVKLYLYVEDLEKTMEKIIANGGKKCSDVLPEGDHGQVMHLQDSEGNGIGIYATKKQ